MFFGDSLATNFVLFTFHTVLFRFLCAPVTDPSMTRLGVRLATGVRNSKPVRVVRNYKGQKTSEYAPKEGNRYDGIYKVVYLL